MADSDGRTLCAPKSGHYLPTWYRVVAKEFYCIFVELINSKNSVPVHCGYDVIAII